MPTVVERFRAFFIITLLLQVFVALPDLVARPAYGAGQLLVCVLWGSLAVFAFRGSDNARKVIAFFSVVGAAAGVLGALGGVLLLADSQSPWAIVLIGVSALSFFLQLGLYKSVTDDAFRAFVTGKAIQRAEAKYAGI